jgi:hypothetical protein
MADDGEKRKGIEREAGDGDGFKDYQFVPAKNTFYAVFC